MRIVKLACTALIVFALVSMWNHREWVTSAYTADPEPIGFDADGIDLSFQATGLGPSPFAIVTAPATDRVALPRVAPAAAVSDISIGGGTSTLTGTVFGPDGPAAGATVVIERFVGSQRAEVRLQADEFGAWLLKNALGGAYRVRAFVPNAYVSPPAEVLFLTVGSSTELSTVLGLHVPTTRVSLSGGVERYPGQDQTVAIVMATTVVDGEGRLVEVPLANTPVRVTIVGPGTLLSSDEALTDGGGAARFLVRCDGLGAIKIQATAEQTLLTSVLPACVPEPPPEPVIGEDSAAVSPEPGGVEEP